MSQAIAVVGISGFVGAHVAAAFLQAGYSVHGSLRNPDAPENAWIQQKLGPLAQSGCELKLFAAELQDPKALSAAFQGCHGVVMSAGVEKQAPETIDLMLAAAENTLQAAAENGIQRVVFTSSTGSTNPPEGEPEIKNELESWSDDVAQVAAGKFSPAAKTRMEKVALAYMQAHPEMRVCIFNPSMIIGPAYQDKAPAAFAFLAAILQGQRMTESIPNDSMSMIDVRDLAQLHRAAMEQDDASGRYFALKQSWHWRDILAAFQRAYPAYTPPVWPEEQTPVRPTQFDFSRRDSLGVSLRDLDEIVQGAVQELQRRGLLS